MNAKKLSLIKPGLLLLVGLGLTTACNEQAAREGIRVEDRSLSFIEIPAETITDKIRGGLLGQMIGVQNGLQYEFKFIEEPGNVSGYVPALPEGAITDDDTDFEWVYIYTMQQQRQLKIPYQNIATLWKERINKNIWCSNRYARSLMDIDIDPPHTGNIALNPWAEFNISGQFLCETFGLIAPAMPQSASKIGLHYTNVAIDYEPAQTTQFFTSMIATAFVESDIIKILDAGVQATDTSSILPMLVADLKEWHRQYPQDWKHTRKLIEEKYSPKTSWIRSNNGYELNSAGVVAALLYGEGDYARTMEFAYNFGWDADCNAATAGTILGTVKGYKWMMSQGWQIVDRYQNTTRDNMPEDETITSFADRVIELFELLNEENGGAKIVSNQRIVYKIPAEKPRAVVPLRTKDSQQKILLAALNSSIERDLLSEDRASSAKAVYLAICLDMQDELSQKHPNQWQRAIKELKGYYKVMNNVFWGSDFKTLNELKEKFIASGFTAPPRKLTDEEVYSSIIWKDPTEIVLE
ncbi:ADP-ribosylglycohydrolase [Flammeovirgaceae bacterium 311]|nr:ADP-ribosylglycohydrolase [Flammeovirgaceae bacterium 311]